MYLQGCRIISGEIQLENRAHKYRVLKRYGHDRGYSVAFRQWRAVGTRCKLLHGYALAFEFSLVGSELDCRNWLYSFGDFKEIKKYLDENFDHKTLVANDDPELEKFLALEDAGVADLNIMDNVGCEKIAESLFWMFDKYFVEKSNGRAKLEYVKVSEHEGNSTTYYGEEDV